MAKPRVVTYEQVYENYCLTDMTYEECALYLGITPRQLHRYIGLYGLGGARVFPKVGRKKRQDRVIMRQTKRGTEQHIFHFIRWVETEEDKKFAHDRFLQNLKEYEAFIDLLEKDEKDLPPMYARYLRGMKN